MADSDAGVRVDSVRMQARAVADPPRNDLQLTSTGRGQEIRAEGVFPPPDFKASRTKPLPAHLDVEPSVSVDEFYRTTTQTVHDYKPQGTILQQPFYKKAAGSWKVHYNYNVIQKLGEKPWRQPLTMGQQCSEAQDQYRGMDTVPGVYDQPAFCQGLQPPTLRDQHVEGTTKGMIPSTENIPLKGDPFVIQDQGALHLSEPYVSTTHKDHRAFSKSELSGYPKKDVATYWQCEDYPKAWGHGMKHNPIPKESVPRQEGPMRDETVLRTATTIPPLSQQPSRVPHRGMQPLYRESFDWPSDDKVKELFVCTVPQPISDKDSGGDHDKTFAVPNMYQTFNSEYGREPQCESS